MADRKVKNVAITNLTIRLSLGDKCCFDVLANGFELTESLTFGELIEYLVSVYRDRISGELYTSGYPTITINNVL